jgi:hypothetical protein
MASGPTIDRPASSSVSKIFMKGVLFLVGPGTLRDMRLLHIEG